MKILLTEEEALTILDEIKTSNFIGEEDLQQYQDILENYGMGEVIKTDYEFLEIGFEDYFKSLTFEGIEVQEKEKFKFI